MRKALLVLLLVLLPLTTSAAEKVGKFTKHFADSTVVLNTAARIDLDTAVRIEKKVGKFTKHFADSFFEASEKGAFGAEMLIVGKTLKVGVNSAELIIHDENDKDLAGAKITVTPWMPGMGHGVNEEPVVIERGGGLYSIENIMLIMGGHWELRLNIAKDGIEDRVVFDFPNVASEKMELHEHEPTVFKMPAGTKFTRFVTSEEGHFMTTFISEVEPVPLNKIHGWKLYLETADGVPVEMANIAVSGEMPEHSHGMPTKPAVTRNLGGGVYIVSGMKFQMPGWWVVEVAVSSGGKEDKATFNLLLK